VPGAAALAQEQSDVCRRVQVDADAGQRLLVGAEVEVLGVDENAVVVEEDRVDRVAGDGGQLTLRMPRFSCFRTVRMSEMRSSR
jgi:hypothetical protein